MGGITLTQNLSYMKSNPKNADLVMKSQVFDKLR